MRPHPKSKIQNVQINCLVNKMIFHLQTFQFLRICTNTQYVYLPVEK